MKTLPWLLAVPGTLNSGRTVVLDPDEGRHVTGSLRRRVGDEIVLADGGGGVAIARVLSIGKGGVEAEIVSVRHEPAPASDGVTLALAVVAGRPMDWAVRMAVEIGIRRFVPIETELTQLQRNGIEARKDHWQRVSMQALKQCRRPWAMEVEEAVTLREFLESSSGGGVVADQEGRALGDLPTNVGNRLVVGPEGGFTGAEDGLFDRYGWPRLRLGPHVLRAETAAVVGGALMVMRNQNR